MTETFSKYILKKASSISTLERGKGKETVFAKAIASKAVEKPVMILDAGQDLSSM